jgi:tetratricopeptide (TPR) repeat protein
MDEETKKLLKECETLLTKRELAKAAHCFEKIGDFQKEAQQRIDLYKKAAAAYHEAGRTENAVSCYRKAAHLLDGEQKADCLLACWRIYIREIVGYLYDRSWELSNKMAGREEVGADIYEDLINESEKRAQEILTEALLINGVDKNRILGEAKQTCREREKGSWGAHRCRGIIAMVENRLRES